MDTTLNLAYRTWHVESLWPLVHLPEEVLVRARLTQVSILLLPARRHACKVRVDRQADYHQQERAYEYRIGNEDIT